MIRVVFTIDSAMLPMSFIRFITIWMPMMNVAMIPLINSMSLVTVIKVNVLGT